MQASWRAAVWSRGRQHGAHRRRQQVLVAASCDGGRLVAMNVATVDVAVAEEVRMATAR